MSSEPTDLPPRTLVLLLAAGSGLCVAGLYYNQPILVAIASSLRATKAEVGLVPMFTQLGYASGIVLTAPLGDRFDRRSVILVKLACLVAALAGAGFAPGISSMCIASLAIGVAATAAQDMVPAAAAVAPAAHRGKIVGSVMTGLLLGILLSRLASGAIADAIGWRAVFWIGAGAVVVLTVVAAIRLPAFPATTSVSYGRLLRSLAMLVRDFPALRRAALVQGLLSAAFGAFWSTLALALAAPPFELGSTAAGLFGLAGAAGAIAAPIAGTIADRRGPIAVVLVGAALVVVAFAGMGIAHESIAVLIAGTIIFDLGTQAALISHQTIIYSLDASARSRLNAVLISSMFVGMAIGAAAASYALRQLGWPGVCALGGIAATCALVARALPLRR